MVVDHFLYKKKEKRPAGQSVHEYI